MRKLNLRTFSSVLIALILILGNAHSMLVVEMTPKNTSDALLKLYTDEVGEYEIKVINVSEEPIENVIIKVVASGNLAIIKGLEERSMDVMELSPMQPFEKKTIGVKVKPVAKPREEGGMNIITVYYGQEKYTHFMGTYVEVIEGPLNVKAELKKYAMSSGEENRIDAELKNTSASEQIRNLRIFLSMPEKFDSKELSYDVAYLNPADSLKKSFFFSPDPSIKGTQHLALIVEFEDSRGKHIIEKNFKIEIQNKAISSALILALITGLVVIYLFMRKGEKKAQAQQ
ncbi:MAG: hypothetical protein J7L44_01865 [Candidatus Diapherotrites archaeon]|nr:hypothetical protein [Candidatus Diapherotrites archaeon]